MRRAQQPERVQSLLADGLEVNGERYNVEILVQDSQSDSNRSAEVSGDLILNEEVNLLIPASTTPTITASTTPEPMRVRPAIGRTLSLLPGSPPPQQRSGARARRPIPK